MRTIKSETIKTKSGRALIMPTPEEDAEIHQGIAEDPDTYELSDEEFKTLRPFGYAMAERRAAAEKERRERSGSEEVAIYYDRRRARRVPLDRRRMADAHERRLAHVPERAPALNQVCRFRILETGDDP